MSNHLLWPVWNMSEISIKNLDEVRKSKSYIEVTSAAGVDGRIMEE